jgi:hypothetical protein
MQDDGGDVLGNLPRSRPGRRSEKRSAGAKKPAAAKRSSAKPKAPAKPKAAAKPRPAAKPRARPSTPKPPPAPAHGGNPVEDAVRAAAKVAETGLRVAGDVTREVLRRLPRP